MTSTQGFRHPQINENISLHKLGFTITLDGPHTHQQPDESVSRIYYLLTARYKNKPLYSLTFLPHNLEDAPPPMQKAGIMAAANVQLVQLLEKLFKKEEPIDGN